MLSNIIILFLKSPYHFLSPIAQTYLTTLFAFLTISRIYVLSICDSFIERVALVLELVYLFCFTSFPVPLSLFTLPLSLIEQHHFRLLTFTSSFFFLTYFPWLFIISFISLSICATITKSSANASLQTFSIPTRTTLSPLVVSLIFHSYLPHTSIS
jgi:hypothetical protein